MPDTICTATCGNYGVISLFDGASTVVETVAKKLGCSPKAILLAENDEGIRKLVCAEFGYRTDQKWGYTVEGSACLYIKDVNLIAENDCLILRQAVALFPGLKWFIVGGSPCQDLTYAGYLHGLLGLVGERSRLFFILLLTIRTMQVLCGSQAIRYLVENAGSMRDVHFVAFCKLLNLPYEPFHRYIWDLAKHTPFVTRKRNFFRNVDDFEPVANLQSWTQEDEGPLLLPGGQTIPFAPLLRTRKTLPFGIVHASWTLYQPHALVWDYTYWGGKESFQRLCRPNHVKIRRFSWDKYIPPPFLDAWKSFLELLQRSDCTSANFDKVIPQLLPMFECDTYKIPLRTLTPLEVSKLSGLQGHWRMTSEDDAEFLPDSTIRDICGNSFHPAIISSALGSNEHLRDWVENKVQGSDNIVADQQKVHGLYAELVGVTKKAGRDQYQRANLPVVELLPVFPAVENASRNPPLPSIEQPILPTRRVVRVSKRDQRIEHGIDATVELLNVDACLVLQQAQLAGYFETLRAPVSVAFEATNLLKFLWGDCQITQARNTSQQNLPHLPSVDDISNIELLASECQPMPKHASIFACLLSAVRATEKSRWPVGYIILVGTDRGGSVFYLGNSQPKLLVLCDYRDCTAPTFTVLRASAYEEALAFGSAPIILSTVRSVIMYNTISWLHAECLGDEWAIHCRDLVASQDMCPCCLFEKLKEIRSCPWHDQRRTVGSISSTTAHLIGVDGGNGTINVTGYIAPLPLHTHLLLFHIISEGQLGDLRLHFGYLATPFCMHYHLPRCSTLPQADTNLSAPFCSDTLPHWLFRRFIVRAAGPKDYLDTWLRPRCLL